MVNLIKQKKADSGGYYNNQPPKNDLAPKKSYNLTIVFAVVVFLSLILFIVINKNDDNSENPVTVTKPKPSKTGQTAVSSSSLPENISFDTNNDYGISSSTLNLKAEELSFGLFYENKDAEYKALLDDYNLPINIKTDVQNYFTISRKYDLDALVEKLNKDGFAIVDQDRFSDSNNFFEAYRNYLKDEVPIYLSSDFVLYYYQTSLKEVYKEIEENIFYENLWDISSYLYEVALTRYKQKYIEVGDINDPVLEGERLELVFFAVALKLLEPIEPQINRKANFVDPKKFTPQEAYYFSVKIPDYIANDVNKETNKIRNAKGVEKSPVLLYERKYSEFKVPDNYQKNAKLTNYYLTRKWLNSIFPLFYKSDQCPDCLLDEYDWLINMLAASLAANDIAGDQDIKNKWAEIYKFISFFDGLRHDLTYLHYVDAFNKLFGPDYDLAYIFSDENKNRSFDIKLLTKELLSDKFSRINGGIERDPEDIDPEIGMRVLQDNYWPNDYLFSELVGREYEYIRTPDIKITPITRCGERLKYRCKGITYDLLNLVSTIKDGGDYYIVNTSYSNLDQGIARTKKVLGKFDVHDWNNNIYWMTLDYLRHYLGPEKTGWPEYMQTNAWEKEKSLPTAAASLVDMQLEADELMNYFEKKDIGGNFAALKTCNSMNYIEPAPQLYDDLIARNDMLLRMIFMLKIPKKTNAATLKLKDINAKLEQLSAISEKELLGQSMDGDECSFVSNFAVQYYVDKMSGKNIKYNFNGHSLTANIGGIKAIVSVNKVNGGLVLNFGSVFDFDEK